jgi:putative ABC transport system permease protein
MPKLPSALRRARSSTAENAPEMTERSRLRPTDLSSEAMAGVVQRPARTVLTMLGTILGVGAFTAILGLTATASGQISTDFTALSATQVTVTDTGNSAEQQNPTMDDFPPDADARVERLDGVVAAGVRWQVFGQTPTVAADDNPQAQAQAQQLTVYAASPGYLTATEPTVQSGVLYNQFHDSRHLHVAVLGKAAAAQLGITNLTAEPAVFINAVAYTVVGVLGNVQRNPEDLLGVFIPEQTALADYGPPATDRAATMLIETKLGAADLIADQAAAELRPDNPTLLSVSAPPNPHNLQDTVSGNLNSLFLILASITLLIGTVGIANTTLVAVLERTKEIGLRRSLGARPRHIAGQFLTETTLLGTIGGLIGTALGIGVVLLVAISHQWTAVLDPVTTLPAPLIGSATGLLAGAYPALRAARIEPLEALRR